jgi:uncharacterized membrane protein YciS (DUF1049 family)
LAREFFIWMVSLNYCVRTAEVLLKALLEYHISLRGLVCGRPLLAILHLKSERTFLFGLWRVGEGLNQCFRLFCHILFCVSAFVYFFCFAYLFIIITIIIYFVLVSLPSFTVGGSHGKFLCFHVMFADAQKFCILQHKCHIHNRFNIGVSSVTSRKKCITIINRRLVHPQKRDLNSFNPPLKRPLNNKYKQRFYLQYLS